MRIVLARGRARYCRSTVPERGTVANEAYARHEHHVFAQLKQLAHAVWSAMPLTEYANSQSFCPPASKEREQRGVLSPCGLRQTALVSLRQYFVELAFGDAGTSGAEPLNNFQVDWVVRGHP